MSNANLKMDALLTEYKRLSEDIEKSVGYRYHMLYLMFLLTAAISAAWASEKIPLEGRLLLVLLTPLGAFTIIMMQLREMVVTDYRVWYIHNVISPQVASLMRSSEEIETWNPLDWHTWESGQIRDQGLGRFLFTGSLQFMDLVIPLALSICAICVALVMNSWEWWAYPIFVIDVVLILLAPIIFVLSRATRFCLPSTDNHGLPRGDGVAEAAEELPS